MDRHQDLTRFRGQAFQRRPQKGARSLLVFGARPLKRVIQRLVLDELATKVLAGEIPDGSRVMADFDPDHPDQIAFSVKG